MSIIKGKTNIVAGFGGTKRSIGEVYFSQSALATDNSGALPLFTGETIASANTIYPEFYNWVTSHTELQCTSAEYEASLTTYGECAKYATKFPVTNTVTAYKYDFSGATGVNNLSVWDFYYEEKGELISTTSKIFYFKKPINFTPASGGTKRLQAFYDPELTKPIVAHKQNTVATALKNVLALHLYLNSTYVLSLEYYDKDQDIANATTKSIWNGANTYVNLPESYAYETTSSTVTTYETDGSLRLPLIRNYIKAANPSEGIKNIKAGLPDHYHKEFNTTYNNYGNTLTSVPDSFVAAAGIKRNTTDRDDYNLMVSDGNPVTPNAGNTGNASASNPIYGKSSTVTPASTTLYPWVVAYTAAIPASTAQAAEFQQGLSGKADTSLSNLSTAGKDLASGLGMPSNRYIDLTLGASGSTYTAPANGYFCLNGKDSGNTGTAAFVMRNQTRYFGVAVTNTNSKMTPSWTGCILPAKKGDIVPYYYEGTLALNDTNWSLRFYYAEGAE